jgi:ADP-ribose pyrophosphatase
MKHPVSKESEIQPWRSLASQELFSALPWVRLSVERVQLADGREISDFYQIQLPEYVAVVAQTEDGQILLEREYRHAIRGITMLVPSGYIEPGETPLTAAQRELLEETGYAASEWHSLGSFVVDGNRGCGKAHLFFAGGASRVAAAKLDEFEKVEILSMPVDGLVEAIQTGRLACLSTVAAIAIALQSDLLSPQKP